MSVVDKILPTISGTDFLGLEKKLDSILNAINGVTRKWKGRKEDEEEKETSRRLPNR